MKTRLARRWLKGGKGTPDWLQGKETRLSSRDEGDGAASDLIVQIILAIEGTIMSAGTIRPDESRSVP